MKAHTFKLCELHQPHRPRSKHMQFQTGSTGPAKCLSKAVLIVLPIQYGIVIAWAIDQLHKLKSFTKLKGYFVNGSRENEIYGSYELQKLITAVQFLKATDAQNNSFRTAPYGQQKELLKLNNERLKTISTTLT